MDPQSIQQYGLVAVVAALISILSNRILPWALRSAEQREAHRRQEEAEMRQAIISAYERFIAQQAETIQFIAGATEALHSLEEAFQEQSRLNAQALGEIREGLAQIRQALQEEIGDLLPTVRDLARRVALLESAIRGGR